MSKGYRLNLELPLDLYKNVKEMAGRKGWTVVGTIRRFLSMSVYIVNEQDDGATVTIKKPSGAEREILFM